MDANTTKKRILSAIPKKAHKFIPPMDDSFWELVSKASPDMWSSIISVIILPVNQAEFRSLCKLE